MGRQIKPYMNRGDMQLHYYVHSNCMVKNTFINDTLSRLFSGSARLVVQPRRRFLPGKFRFRLRQRVLRQPRPHPRGLQQLRTLRRSSRIFAGSCNGRPFMFHAGKNYHFLPLYFIEVLIFILWHFMLNQK